MSEVKKEKKVNKKMLLIPIIAGSLAVLTLVGFLIWHFVTLPNTEKALKYSPFNNTGEWYSSSHSFTIISEKDLDTDQIKVDGYMVHRTEGNAAEYSFKITYEENKGFDRKYDVTIYLTENRGLSKYSCHYEFEEDKLVLKEFKNISGIKIFNNVNKITFNKL